MDWAVPEICEALLAPFQIMGEPVGTVWVLSHDDERRFDGEDARRVEGLAELRSRVVQGQPEPSG